MGVVFINNTHDLLLHPFLLLEDASCTRQTWDAAGGEHGRSGQHPAGEPTCVISDNESRIPSRLVTTFLPPLVFSQFVLVALVWKCGIR